MEQRNQEENSVWIDDKKRPAAIQRQSAEERQRKIEREIARMCTHHVSHRFSMPILRAKAQVAPAYANKPSPRAGLWCIWP